MNAGNRPGASPSGLEVERFDQCRSEFPQRRIAVDCHHEWIDIRGIGECRDFMPGLEQVRPTDGLVDHLDRVGVVVESGGKSVDRPAK